MAIIGFTEGGALGYYFPTSDLTGDPDFIRKDNRIRFLFPDGHKPGGSSGTGYATAANGWSARWLVGIRVRVAETFTFSTSVSGKFRLYGRIVGAGSYDTLIDSWTASTIRTLTADVALDPEIPYEIKIEYAGNDGQKDLVLSASSASQPTLTVIDPLFKYGEHIMKAELYGNIFLSGRGWAGNFDSNYRWNGDVQFVVQESLQISPLNVDPLIIGTCNYKFKGSCTDVDAGGNARNFTRSYDSGTNTTTGTFEFYDNGANATFFRIYGAVNVSEIEIMKPGVPSGTTLDPVVKAAMTKVYTVYRNQVINSVETVWADRTVPAYPYQLTGKSTTSAEPYYYGNVTTTDNGPSYELLIKIANETGRDLEISLPPFANDDYIDKLAKLFKYGSDGVNPYTSVQTSPVYPPLNSNLDCTFEIANELWNTGAGYDKAWLAISYLADYHYNTPTVLGGELDSDYYIRRTQFAYARTAQMSEVCRSIFGSDHLTRFHFYYGFQYGNSNNTASNAFYWFGKLMESGGLSAAGLPQRKIKEYTDYAGGATYYGSSNPDGVSDLAPDPYSLVPTVSSGFSVRPGGATNTFAGPAGIVHEGSIAIDPEGSRSQCMFAAAGGRITMNFTVPSSQVSNVYSFGVRAVNRLASTVRFNMYLDYGTGNQQDLFSGSFSQTGGWYTPTFKTTDWDSRIVPWTLSGYYPSKFVNLDAGSSHTVTILVEGTAGSDTIDAERPVILFSEIRVCSSDNLATGLGLSSGQANGQPQANDVNVTLRDIVRHTKIYGLEYFAYEGGVSLGGDTGGNAIQNKFKWSDPRMQTAQKDSQTRFFQAGGYIQVLGTYGQQPNYGEPYGEQGWYNYDTYPIQLAMIESSSEIPTQQNFDFTAPSTLKGSDFSTADDTVDGFLAWVLNVTTAGTYLITGSNLGTGRILVDGNELVGGQAFLTIGQHGILLRAGTGAAPSSTAEISIKFSGVPSTAPILSTLVGQTVSWNSIGGATGYVVRWGDSTGRYYNRQVSATTSATISDINILSSHRMAVAAVNGSGEGIPGVERSVRSISQGSTNTFALWNTRPDRSNLDLMEQIQLDNSGIVVSGIQSYWDFVGDYVNWDNYITGMHNFEYNVSTDHPTAYSLGKKWGFVVTATPEIPFYPQQFKFSAQFHEPSLNPSVRVYIDGTPFYTSPTTNQYRYDATVDLSSLGPWTSAKTIEITYAPSGMAETLGIGHEPNVPSKLTLTGYVPNQFPFIPIRSMMWSAGFMGL